VAARYAWCGFYGGQVGMKRSGMKLFGAVLMWCSVASGLLTLPFLCGCSAFNYVEQDAPEPVARLSPMTPRPRIAVVLGVAGRAATRTSV
jgi:hypothetical protein